jgi:hypothetical protein
VVEHGGVDGDEEAEEVRVVAVPHAVVHPRAVVVCAAVQRADETKRGAG